MPAPTVRQSSPLQSTHGYTGREEFIQLNSNYKWKLHNWAYDNF